VYEGVGPDGRVWLRLWHQATGIGGHPFIILVAVGHRVVLKEM
jgi:hypothetical protein